MQITDEKKYVKAIGLLHEMGGMFSTRPTRQLVLSPFQVQALQKAGKSFEVQVGPDQGHSGLRSERMMEFFIENLVMNQPNHASQVAGSSQK